MGRCFGARIRPESITTVIYASGNRSAFSGGTRIVIIAVLNRPHARSLAGGDHNAIISRTTHVVGKLRQIWENTPS